MNFDQQLTVQTEHGDFDGNLFTFHRRYKEVYPDKKAANFYYSFQIACNYINSQKLDPIVKESVLLEHLEKNHKFFSNFYQLMEYSFDYKKFIAGVKSDPIIYQIVDLLPEYTKILFNSEYPKIHRKATFDLIEEKKCVLLDIFNDRYAGKCKKVDKDKVHSVTCSQYFVVAA